MFGHRRKKQNSDLMHSLCFAYDDKMYKHACEVNNGLPLSIKQVALIFNFPKPLKKLSKADHKDPHPYAAGQIAEASFAFTATEILEEKFTGTGRAHNFLKKEDTAKNFQKTIGPQFRALQMLASGGEIAPSDKSRVLTMEIVTNLEELFDEKNREYYYEPTCALHISGNGGTYQII